MNFWIELDRTVTLFINSYHSPLSDSFFYLYSKVAVWIPLYISLLYLFFKHLNKHIWVLLLSVGLVILLSDQISSGILKPLVGRLRPSHDPDIQHLIHLVNGYRGALYGFVSSHAANTAGIATLFILLIRRNFIVPVLVVWTLLSSFSRVYLGLHFVGDVLAGSIIGIASGFCGFYLYQYLMKRIKQKTTPAESHCLFSDGELLLPTLIWLISCIVMFVVSVVQHA